MASGVSARRNPSSSELIAQFFSGVWRARGKDFNVFNPRHATNRSGDLFNGTVRPHLRFSRFGTVNRQTLQYWVIVAAGVGSGLLAGALALVLSRI